MYKPPEPEPPAELPQATAQLPDELLSVPLASSPPTSTALVFNDIANFDIGFDISDVESDSNDDIDTSADIFLLGLYRISAPAPANPESGHFRKSSQVRLWPHF